MISSTVSANVLIENVTIKITSAVIIIIHKKITKHAKCIIANVINRQFIRLCLHDFSDFRSFS